MFGRHHFPWSLLALVGVTVVFLLATPARAAIILAVPETGNGVIACDSEQCKCAPSTDMPAMAFIGSAEAAMSQNGSFIEFALTLNGSFGQLQYAGTADSTHCFPQPIDITILGTAGEPVGTPVSLELNNGVTPDPGAPRLDPEFTNSLGNGDYLPNTDVVINGYKVGDSFFYWASIGTRGTTPYTYQIFLSVQETEIAAIPEPGTLALLMTAGLSLGVVLLRRRGRIGKSFSAGG
jgi:hypothetical protein